MPVVIHLGQGSAFGSDDFNRQCKCYKPAPVGVAEEAAGRRFSSRASAVSSRSGSSGAFMPLATLHGQTCLTTSTIFAIASAGTVSSTG